MSSAATDYSGSSRAERGERGRERLHDGAGPQDQAHAKGVGAVREVREKDSGDDRERWSGRLEGLLLRLSLFEDPRDASWLGQGLRPRSSRWG